MSLTTRIRNYELAAKMQLAVPEVTSLAGETAATRAMYGLDQPESADFGRGCLLARCLLERGVRFVQLFSGGSFGNPRINWDGHENMRVNHGQEAPRIDRPVAGLLRDLRQRGMLDDTLVLFTTEFGRTPFAQSAANIVGGGAITIKRVFGMAGRRRASPGRPTVRPTISDIKRLKIAVHWNDFHATVLHLLGIDHER